MSMAERRGDWNSFSWRPPVLEFIQFMKDKLAHFVKHDFTQKWQAKQYRQCIKTFPIGTVVSVIDYAENYTFLPRNEIQSGYWTSKQVTILVHIFYYHTQYSTADDRDVRKVVHFFISDDRKHDSFFVQYAFGLLHNWCEEKAIEFEHHWVWSDGAPTQFKNSTNFFFVARYVDQTFACILLASVTLKDLRNPSWVVKAKASTTLEGFRKSSIASCSFFGFKYPSEHGGKSMMWNFFCSGMDPTLLRTREFTCMCPHCLEGQFEACELQEWVTEWDFRSLVLSPTGVQSINDITLADEFHADADHEVLSDTLAVGDVFAKKLKGPKFVYVEAKKKDPTVIYSHLVRAVKMRMTPMAQTGKQKDTPRFCIDSETHEQILMAISKVEAPSFEKI
ncbi:hypothetical protein R1sor_014693 [Riccia sorocarpa]|uniref:Uncharacterized protein n=1 Tax=Riccia sorocarpa TaxID=122646 RepID=A0ABD3HG93_9MARC